MCIVVRSSLAVAFILLAACASGPVTSPPSLSKLQSRSLPPEIVTDRVVRQLAEILIPTPPGGSATPVRPLNSVWYWTKPRATDIPDVCESDLVAFFFTPVPRRDPDASAPTRVSSVSASTHYRLLASPPPGAPELLTEEGMRRLQRKCDDLNPGDLHMISAPAAETIREGAKLFDRVTLLRQEDPNRFVFICGEKDTRCPTDSRKLSFANVNSIDSCEVSPPDFLIECTQFIAADFAFRVFTSWKNDKKEIAKVEVRPFVVMRHELID